jgi:hypothetical protein
MKEVQIAGRSGHGKVCEARALPFNLPLLGYRGIYLFSDREYLWKAAVRDKSSSNTLRSAEASLIITDSRRQVTNPCASQAERSRLIVNRVVPVICAKPSRERRISASPSVGQPTCSCNG